MQSTNIRQIKAALWDQAFIGGTRVSWGVAQVVAIRRRKGQLLVMIRGWGRWYPVESVSIERMLVGPHLARGWVRTVGREPGTARLPQTPQRE